MLMVLDELIKVRAQRLTLRDYSILWFTNVLAKNPNQTKSKQKHTKVFVLTNLELYPLTSKTLISLFNFCTIKKEKRRKRLITLFFSNLILHFTRMFPFVVCPQICSLNVNLSFNVFENYFELASKNLPPILK